jgi:biotin carboxyl carrier protein
VTIYLVRVSEREYQVDIAGDQIKVDGRVMRARLTPINQSGHFLLQTESDQHEVHIQENGKGTFLATIASRYFKVQIDRNLNHRPKPLPRSQGDLKAPMPAKVIDILIKPGEKVDAGQTVVLLESMKMQMEIKAPFSGIVESVFIHPNGQVEKGSKLIFINPEV